MFWQTAYVSGVSGYNLCLQLDQFPEKCYVVKSFQSAKCVTQTKANVLGKSTKTKLVWVMIFYNFQKAALAKLLQDFLPNSALVYFI